MRSCWIGAVVLYVGLVGTSAETRSYEAAELKPATLEDWDRYVRATEQRIDRELTDGGRFLAYELQPGINADMWRQQLEAGQMPTLELSSRRPDGQPLQAREGRVHHWLGAVLIEGVTLKTVMALIRDYADQPPFQEDVLASRILSRDGDKQHVYLKLRRTKIVTVTYNTEHDVQFRSHTSARTSSRSRSTRIAELEYAGTAREREKPAGDDRGFLWRMNAYWRYAEVPRGVIVECESLTLSRDIPMLLRPLIGPMVDGVARESMARTLTSIRAKLARPATPSSKELGTP